MPNVRINSPRYLIIHTEASPIVTNAPRFDVVNQYHQQRLFDKSSLGFYVGYHYFIEKSGKVIQARLDTDEGCHTIGYNLNSLGICLAGNGDVELPTEAQVVSLTDLINQKGREYTITKERILPHRRFLGHREKTCYGTRLKDSWASDLLIVDSFVQPTTPVQPTPSVEAAKISILQQLLAKLTELLNIYLLKK